MLKYWRSNQRLGAKKINLSDNWQNSNRILVCALSLVSPHIILEVNGAKITAPMEKTACAQ